MTGLALASLLLLAAAPPADGLELPELAGSNSQAFLLSTLGAPAGGRIAGEALTQRTEALASVVRCPVCQGSSVADSPSPMARNMKQEIRDLLAQGYSEAQVLDYFERAYGEFIRLEPKANGFNALLWLLPSLALLAGLGAVVALTRRSRAGPRIVGRGELPRDADLARSVLEVRRLAYGWPGGLAPPESGEGQSGRMRPDAPGGEGDER